MSGNVTRAVPASEPKPATSKQPPFTISHVLHAIPLLIAMTVVWIIMNEMFNWIILVSGLLIGAIALGVTHYLIGRSYTHELWLGWRAGIIFIPYLMVQITLAAINMVKIILRGDDHNVEFVYHTILPDDLSIFLFASSIILTPGSMAIAREGNDVTVLSVDETFDDARAGLAQLERGISGLNNPLFGRRPTITPEDQLDVTALSTSAGTEFGGANVSGAEADLYHGTDTEFFQPGVHDELP